MPPAGLEVARSDECVLTVKHLVDSAEWEQWYLLIADAHWDNPLCDRDRLKRDLDLAVKRNAGIFSFGDFFCAMQGKADPRHVKDSVRPEHQGGNYFDLLVDSAAEWLKPYAPHLVLMSEGNHEWNIRRRWETDLHQRLCRALDVPMMRESGFIRLQFDGSKFSAGRSRQVLYFHHGYGGGGPVTKGFIQNQRADAMIADADVLISGHIHERNLGDGRVVGVNHNGRMVTRERVHLRCSSYKDEYRPGEWHVQQGRGPRPLGGWWLHYTFDRSDAGCIRRREIRA
jgi:hypothetical protein